MAKLDLKIVNGSLATTAGVFPVDIGIKGGKISAIAKWGTLPDADHIVEAKDKVVLPGGVDTHVHAADPGFEQAGMSFALTSQAGALGGVTTIVDMPIQIPMTTDPESFDTKFTSIKPKAYVDFAMWATCKADDVSTIIPLKAKGVVGYKLVMQESVGGIMPYHDDGAIYEALPEVKKTGLLATIHAENQEMIIHLQEKLKKEGRTDPRAFLDCHPIISELEAIHRILFIAKYMGARINIAHCGMAEGIDLVDQAKKEGQPVTVETCIHYLTIDDSIFDKRGILPKLSPPLRDRKHVDMLWQRVRDGKVDCVASDHVAYPLDPFKKGNIWEASAGAPGIQTMFPLLITEGVNKGRITLPQLVKVMSEGPAKVVGLYPKKGSALIGADADFAIFDLSEERQVKLEDQVQLQWTLYEGMKVVYPDVVLVRGKAIVDKGQVVGKAGYGEFCTPQQKISK